MIGANYGYGPALDKIRQAWCAMDFNRSEYITRREFSTRAKYEIERILSQPNYLPQGGYGYPPQAIPSKAYLLKIIIHLNLLLEQNHKIWIGWI